VVAFYGGGVVRNAGEIRLEDSALDDCEHGAAERGERVLQVVPDDLDHHCLLFSSNGHGDTVAWMCNPRYQRRRPCVSRGLEIPH
jgi:hypothetical protein